LCVANTIKVRRNQNLNTTNGLLAKMESSYVTTCFCLFFVAIVRLQSSSVNPLNAKLNPICHLLALLGARHILRVSRRMVKSLYNMLNPLNAELNPICYLLALLGAHHFLHVSRIRLLMSYIYIYIYIYIYGAPILDVSRSHTPSHTLALIC